MHSQRRGANAPRRACYQQGTMLPRPHLHEIRASEEKKKDRSCYGFGGGKKRDERRTSREDTEKEGNEEEYEAIAGLGGASLKSSSLGTFRV